MRSNLTLRFLRPHNSPGLPSPCCALEPTGSGHRLVFQLPLAQLQQPVHIKVAHVPTLVYIAQQCIITWSSVCPRQTFQVKTGTVNSGSPLTREGSSEHRLGKVHEVVLFLALHCCKSVNGVSNNDSSALPHLRQCHSGSVHVPTSRHLPSKQSYPPQHRQPSAAHH